MAGWYSPGVRSPLLFERRNEMNYFVFWLLALAADNETSAALWRHTKAVSAEEPSTPIPSLPRFWMGGEEFRGRLEAALPPETINRLNLEALRFLEPDVAWPPGVDNWPPKTPLQCLGDKLPKMVWTLYTDGWFK